LQYAIVNVHEVVDSERRLVSTLHDDVEYREREKIMKYRYQKKNEEEALYEQKSRWWWCLQHVVERWKCHYTQIRVENQIDDHEMRRDGYEGVRLNSKLGYRLRLRGRYVHKYIICEQTNTRILNKCTHKLKRACARKRQYIVKLEIGSICITRDGRLWTK